MTQDATTRGRLYLHPVGHVIESGGWKLGHRVTMRYEVEIGTFDTDEQARAAAEAAMYKAYTVDVKEEHRA